MPTGGRGDAGGDGGGAWASGGRERRARQRSPTVRTRSSEAGSRPVRDTTSAAADSYLSFMTTTIRTAPAAGSDSFVPRHVGPSEAEIAEMLATMGYPTLDALIDATIPDAIRLRRPLAIHGGRSEHEALAAMRAIARKNRIFRSYLGYGYSDTLTPPVIQRNILENPGWYTAYTPYQAEIAQGRLEALMNYNTAITHM